MKVIAKGIKIFMFSILLIVGEFVFANQDGALFSKTVVYFDFDDASIQSKSIKSLDSLVLQLQEHPNLSIRLVGYADPVGDDSYNLHLSETRAISCRDYLIKAGILANRILIDAQGESLISGLDSNENWARRRVECMPIIMKQ